MTPSDYKQNTMPVDYDVMPVKAEIGIVCAPDEVDTGVHTLNWNQLMQISIKKTIPFTESPSDGTMLAKLASAMRNA